MSFWYPYFNKINLFVEGRIPREDAERQTRTAKEILRRLKDRPGLILADEVGMGKTFVSLAVAASVAFADRKKRPVVVMVPSSLREKWPRDFEVFREKCLPPEWRERLTYSRAEGAVDFLKLLDDPPHRAKTIIFLTHGAMARSLNDKWTKLAIIRRALYRRHNTGDLCSALCRSMGALLELGHVHRKTPEVWYDLLNTDPSHWLKVLNRYGIDPEFDNDRTTDDDPVPQAVIDVLSKIESSRLDNLFMALKEIPRRHTKNYRANLYKAKELIKEEMTEVWTHCMRSLKINLPLLILDEAHHLKNPHTNFASLFQDREAEEDMKAIQGRLFGAFERMLFLTATPFQLGHYELCSVLERFKAVNWRVKNAPSYGKDEFVEKITALRHKLDEAQEAAIRLDRAWGALQREDLKIDGEAFKSVEDWWTALLAPADQKGTTDRAKHVLKNYRDAYNKMRKAEEALRPWVIRHLKQKTLPKPNNSIMRRKRIVGRAVTEDGVISDESGIAVEGNALLPFLLAARLSVLNPDARPVFAEGLSSSYEAFRDTRVNRDDIQKTLNDDHIDLCAKKNKNEVESWYLERLDDILPRDGIEASSTHPKIAATVRRAMELWGKGEKVLVFCYYVATGKALRQHISTAINRAIMERGAERLNCGTEKVMAELERLGDKISAQTSPLRRVCDRLVEDIFNKKDFKILAPLRDDILRVVRRFIRTPSFLIRFFPLEEGEYKASSMERAFYSRDASGLTLHDIIEGFFNFLVERCGESERRNYIEAVVKLQPGSHTGADVLTTYDDDERSEIQRENLAPNVRLVYGKTKHETRQRYMLAFNTPFYPEILVASSVMAEGLDLHLNCRHVIHHDLCWNPSNLEQRTGRVDRIGSKAEKCGQSIHIYIPYISATQDEKMYRVVMDRERWFKVVMGEKFKVDVRTTDRLAERIPLPDSVADALAFRLQVHDY